VNPHLSAAEVKDILQVTADKIKDRDLDIISGTNRGQYDAQGRCDWFGFGKVNAAQAVAEARRRNKDGTEFVEQKEATGMAIERYEAFIERIKSMSEKQLLGEVAKLGQQMIELEKEFPISIPDSQGGRRTLEPQGSKNSGKYTELDKVEQISREELLRLLAEALYRIIELREKSVLARIILLIGPEAIRDCLKMLNSCQTAYH
jgi:hypothetical protein